MAHGAAGGPELPLPAQRPSAALKQRTWSRPVAARWRRVTKTRSPTTMGLERPPRRETVGPGVRRPSPARGRFRHARSRGPRNEASPGAGDEAMPRGRGPAEVETRTRNPEDGGQIRSRRRRTLESAKRPRPAWRANAGGSARISSPRRGGASAGSASGFFRTSSFGRLGVRRPAATDGPARGSVTRSWNSHSTVQSSTSLVLAELHEDGVGTGLQRHAGSGTGQSRRRDGTRPRPKTNWPLNQIFQPFLQPSRNSAGPPGRTSNSAQA